MIWLWKVTILRIKWSLCEVQFQHYLYIINKGVFKTSSNIYYGLFCENSQRLCGIHYFREKLHVRCQTGFRIRLCYIWCNPINRWYAYFYSARDETFYIFFCSSHSENVVFLLLVYNILLFRNHRVLFLVLLVVEFLPSLHNLILFLQEYFRLLILLNAIIECSV